MSKECSTHEGYEKCTSREDPGVNGRGTLRKSMNWTQLAQDRGHWGRGGFSRPPEGISTFKSNEVFWIVTLCSVVVLQGVTI
jgi:hypothetical protein